MTRDAAPVLIMHGDQDDVVPLAQSVKLAEALRRAGVEVTLQVYKGSGHGGRAFTSPESWKLIEELLCQPPCCEEGYSAVVVQGQCQPVLPTVSGSTTKWCKRSLRISPQAIPSSAPLSLGFRHTSGATSSSGRLQNM